MPHPDDSLPETPGWRPIGIVLDGDPIDVHGLNPWGHSWRDTGEVVAMRNPSWPTQVHRVPVYTMGEGTRLVTFATGELSNQVWGFFVPSGPVIHRATADDWAAYRAIRLAALRDAPEAFTATAAGEEQFDETEWRRRIGAARTFIAWHDGDAVGCVTGLPEAETPQWTVVAMWVAPPARRSGVSDSLLRALADAARAEQAVSLHLWVVVGNSPAIALYERCGYRPTGERATLPDGRHELVLRLQL